MRPGVSMCCSISKLEVYSNPTRFIPGSARGLQSRTESAGRSQVLSDIAFNPRGSEVIQANSFFIACQTFLVILGIRAIQLEWMDLDYGSFSIYYIDPRFSLKMLYFSRICTSNSTFPLSKGANTSIRSSCIYYKSKFMKRFLSYHKSYQTLVILFCLWGSSKEHRRDRIPFIPYLIKRKSGAVEAYLIIRESGQFCKEDFWLSRGSCYLPSSVPTKPYWV